MSKLFRLKNQQTSYSAKTNIYIQNIRKNAIRDILIYFIKFLFMLYQCRKKIKNYTNYFSYDMLKIHFKLA